MSTSRPLVAPEIFLQPVMLDGQALRIEACWLGPAAEVQDPQRPLIVFLHEGLGSLSQWRDFPARLCEALQLPGLVFSRPGYGHSTPRTEPWPQDYLQRQARGLLPACFAAFGLAGRPLLLFGHSDGASLALLYAAHAPAHVLGVVAMAPHLFVEPVTLLGLQAARTAYEQGESLRKALARHHADTDSAFYGWNDAWLRPGFEAWNIEDLLRGRLPCPILAVQGVHDEYGSLRQIEAIAELHEDTRLVALPDCGHSPHKDQPERLIAAVRDWRPGRA